MLTSIRRVANGVHGLKKSDSSYFRKPDDSGHSHFREDVRAIIGGALAAAFVAAALANMVTVPGEGPLIIAAGLAGGIAGKFFVA